MTANVFVSRTLNRFRSVVAVAILAASICAAHHGLAQGPVTSIAETVARPFSLIEGSFVALAEVMPSEKYSFKPSEGEFNNARTFAEQIKHVACAHFAFFNEIEKKEPPAACHTGGPSSATSKAELLAYLRDSFAYGKTVLNTTTMANALEPVTGPYGGPSTRLGIMTLAVWHASDHYGQLVVYLRLNGIVPPASQPARSR